MPNNSKITRSLNAVHHKNILLSIQQNKRKQKLIYRVEFKDPVLVSWPSRGSFHIGRKPAESSVFQVRSAKYSVFSNLGVV